MIGYSSKLCDYMYPDIWVTILIKHTISIHLIKALDEHQ